MADWALGNLYDLSSAVISANCKLIQGEMQFSAIQVAGGDLKLRTSIHCCFQHCNCMGRRPAAQGRHQGKEFCLEPLQQMILFAPDQKANVLLWLLMDWSQIGTF